MFKSSPFAAVAIALLVLCHCNECAAQPEPPTGKNWQLVPELSDEFDGDSLDTKKWSADPEGHPALDWIGRPPGLFLERAVRLRDGMMEILVGKLPKPVVSNKYKEPATYLYHGGIVRAVVPTSVGHYYECRMKMNKTEMGGGFWIMSRGTPGKKHEIDITESVGHLSEKSQAWAKHWDAIMHSNAIRRTTPLNPEAEQHQNAKHLEEKNSDRFFRYACWWESPKELKFYLDGEYVYSIEPPVDFDQEMFLQLSIECYDWNPIPDDGGLVVSATVQDRTTLIDYVRTYKLVDANQ
ncbi:Beta-porphyranase B precursor [Rubripirellula obstinata]|uniref:Beta-porphyranase B n=1 Tax=Rubripirellula obstinata TaxID=406547 RepID=A0A5B1CKN4_9BACT|nr:family 16 glycosylhydrolase [Rubripirellula obstinata]KAA1261116.1 Beta-porphyranase B precursor [Rubripirellula obstinata]